MRLVRFPALVLGLAAVLAIAAPASARQLEGFSCAYVEKGRTGPEDNALVVSPVWLQEVILHRNGKEIQVFAADISGSSWREDAIPVDCAGPRATIHNIDRIEIRPDESRGINWITGLVVNLSGGPVPALNASDHRPDDPDPAASGGLLAPGADRSEGARASEIEIAVYQRPRAPRGDDLLMIVGTNQNDHFTISRRGYWPSVNLNTGKDGDYRDSDIWPMPVVKSITLQGKGGDDRIDGWPSLGSDSGNGMTARPMPGYMTLTAEGGQGKDQLLGHPGVDGFDGGGGNDLLRGRDGIDHLDGGPGADRAFGGRGNDIIGNYQMGDKGKDDYFGGPGKDFFYASDSEADRIFCGKGLDETQFDYKLDRRWNCERPRTNR